MIFLFLVHIGNILNIQSGVNCYNYYICKGDEVDEESSMDNTSLAAMYGGSHSSATVISQPERKRSHTEDDFVEIIHSQSSYFHEPRVEPVNSPHVDTHVASEVGEEKLARDRRPLKLSRNKFAVNARTDDRKTGFSLNMSIGEEVREVKSRYCIYLLIIIKLFIIKKIKINCIISKQYCVLDIVVVSVS